jgi:hypothetical protein
LGNSLLLEQVRKVDLNTSEFALSQFRSCATSDIFPDVFVDQAPKNEALAYTIPGSNDVSVVINPRWAINSVSDWAGGKVVEIPSVFSQQY